MNFKIPSKLKAVTIIELTIVLTILGMLTVIFLAGTEIIKAAKIRTITKYISEFEQAIYQFRIQHNQLPGDFSKATSLWSVDNFNDSCGGYDNGTAIVPFDSTVKGFDGDGSGYVENQNSGSSSNASSIDVADANAVFCHLSLARLLKNNASNALHISNKGSTAARTGMSVDSNNALFLIGIPQTLAMDDSQSSPIHPFSYKVIGEQNRIYLLGVDAQNNNKLLSPLPAIPVNTSLTTKEIFALDSKIDDGRPGTGKITTLTQSNRNVDMEICCATDNTTNTPGTEEGVCKPHTVYSYNSKTKNACYISYSSSLF